MKQSAQRNFLKKNWPGNLGKEISIVVANVPRLCAVAVDLQQANQARMKSNIFRKV
jgi:hypothetical protein